MTFVACGLSHKTAPTDVRERFYFPKEKIAESLRDLKKNVLINDAVILSTCNRTEIYCSSVSQPKALSAWLADNRAFSQDELLPHMYIYHGEESIKHVFRVVSGIDSMVLGEPQIFGQLKEAVSIAENTGTLNGSLRKFFQHAFSVGKKIRTDTDIGVNPVSLGKIIFNCAQKTIKDISNARVLLIGAGEMIQTMANVLNLYAVKDICIANRTISKAKSIAEKLHARVCHLNEFELADADIIISAIEYDQVVISKEAVIEGLKKRRQKTQVFFDLGVPHNIEPAVKKIKNINVYSFDELSEILDHNRNKRLVSVHAAEKLIETHTKQFMLNLRSLSVADAVKKYRHKMNIHRDAQVQKALQDLSNGGNPEKIIKKVAHQLTNAFLHTPSVNLKKAACQEDWVLVHTIEKLWDL